MPPPSFEQIVPMRRRNVLHERQDSSPDSTINDASPSTVTVTTSPTTTHNSRMPEIGGSEGAFIGLVVALSLIFLISSTAIFLLLRYNNPTASERARRRQHSIRRRGARHPLPIGLHDPDGDALAAGSLKEKLGNMFKGRRTGSGWVQTNGGDEWDSGDEELVGGERREMTHIGIAQESKRARFVESDGSAHGGRAASPVTPYNDPFSHPNIHVQAPSGPTPPAYWHDAQRPDASYSPYFPSTNAPRHGDRQLSTDSAESVQTFPGGTKFKELV